MNCPKCKATKHRIPESRRTDDHVWRIRVCNMCHHTWITQEVITDLLRFPSEVHKFHNDRRRAEEPKPKKSAFDTSSLKDFRW